MLERMEIQGVCYVEVDDLHRNFLQANGGDFLFPCYPIHVQVDENGVGFVLIACVWLWRKKFDLVKVSSQGFTTTPFQI